MEKYIVKIWYRYKGVIKVERLEIKSEEILSKTIKDRIRGKIIHYKFE